MVASVPDPGVTPGRSAPGLVLLREDGGRVGV
jgi:hypothetical protein